MILAAYLVETGLILVVSPWTVWWRVNFFAATLPWVHVLMATILARGAVSAIGLLTVVAGMVDLKGALEGPGDRAVGPPADRIG